MAQMMEQPTAPDRSAAGASERLLRFTLGVMLADVVAFGGALLFAPAFVVETIGGIAGVPLHVYFSIRWAGGLLLGMGLGVWYMLRNPKGQLPMFRAFTAGFLLAGVGKVWSGLGGEYGGPTWWYVVVLAGTVGVGLLVAWTGYRARHLLG